MFISISVTCYKNHSHTYWYAWKTITDCKLNITQWTGDWKPTNYKLGQIIQNPAGCMAPDCVHVESIYDTTASTVRQTRHIIWSNLNSINIHTHTHRQPQRGIVPTGEKLAGKTQMVINRGCIWLIFSISPPSHFLSCRWIIHVI